MKAKFLMVGDCAVSVQMGSEISLEVNQLVRVLLANIENNPIEGITEMVPTYSALMIHYKPEIITFEQLKRQVEQRIEEKGEAETLSQKLIHIPICYAKEYAPDLDDCAAFEDISREEFIRMHSEHEYYTYMLGFAPGHAYKARFEEPFHFKRRESPRVSIPGQSIVAQLNLSNLIPFPQPCGWNIVGATPLTICDYTQEDPFLVHAGEWVKYDPISEREYQKIRKDVLKGTYRIHTEKKAVK